MNVYDLSTHTNLVLGQALLWAKTYGWYVFPVLVKQKPNGKYEKIALINWGTEASNDPDMISAMLTSKKRKPAWRVATHVGVACEPSNVWVIDEDEDGAAAALDLPETLILGTNRGRHFVFRPAEFNQRSQTGQPVAGVDIRGNGGMFVLYGDIIHDADIAHWPFPNIIGGRQEPEAHSIGDVGSYYRGAEDYLQMLTDAGTDGLKHQATRDLAASLAAQGVKKELTTALVQYHCPVWDQNLINSIDSGYAKFAPKAQKGPLAATPFEWVDPATIPPRPWVYGHHLIRKQVSVTVAPGGVGKSSLTIVEALAMVTWRELLGDLVPAPLNVWVYNLEDPRDELNRRIVAAIQHYDLKPQDMKGRLFVDTGRERALTTAIQGRDGVQILKPEMDALAEEIMAREIDVLIVDPFVSTHLVSENDNGAIDLVAKEWARLADQCNCAIELVHHTRKLNGEQGTTESGRGASALLSAARSGRVLNKMSDELKIEAGVQSDPSTYFAVVRDKANLAPVGKRVWRRMASVQLVNGDSVGVVVPWGWPDTFDGVTVDDLLAVQKALDGKQKRFSDQAGGDWAGHVVADVLGLCAEFDKKRIKKMINDWLRSGALVKGEKMGPIRKPVPTIEVGEWATK